MGIADPGEVDLRALALHPGEAVAQGRRRRHLGESEQFPEGHAVAHLRRPVTSSVARAGSSPNLATSASRRSSGAASCRSARSSARQLGLERARRASRRAGAGRPPAPRGPRRSARRTRAGRRPGRGGARRGRAPRARATVCAIDCGRMRAPAARSLTLCGPSRSSRPSTVPWGSGKPCSTRRRRTSWPSDTRSSAGERRLSSAMRRVSYTTGKLYRLPV